MKKLSEPVATEANRLLDDAILRKKNAEHINKLNANKIYIKSRYVVFQTNRDKLEKIGISIISEDDKEAIHSSFTSSFKKRIKENELKLVYESCAGICPFCGVGKLEEVDHYIPKEHYPEFTLYPLNLMPICNKCNKKKRDKFLGNNNERKFINFYADSINDLEFIQITITFTSTVLAKTTKIRYIADFSKITNIYLRKIVEHHYEELDLLNRYAEAAIDELSDLESIFLNQDDSDETEIRNAVKRAIIGNRNTQLKKAGKNDWKYLLYEKLLTVGYVDELVKYVCT